MNAPSRVRTPATRRLAQTLLTLAAAVGLTLGTGTCAQAAGDSSSGAPAPAAPAGRPPAAKPTVVVEHGAWADSSSWAAVTERLQREGFLVDVPPDPLRGIAADAAYLTAYLGTVKGPIVLVGHSYGGAVISNAATGNANVQALVFVDAFIPDKGETLNQLTTAMPGAALAVKDPTTVFDPVPFPGGGGNVDLYVKQELFPGFFAGGIDPRLATVLAAGQRPIAASALGEPSGDPAWRTIPSWAFIGTADRIIPPAEQEIMAARAKSHVVRADAPHLAMVSAPSAVADLISQAAGRS